MSKTKLIVTLLIANCLLLIGAKTVSASVLSIQTLPTYINTNDFKLSCTSSGGVVDFSVSKNGGAFTTFASVDTSVNPCIAQVTSSQVNDQTNYTFKVTRDTTDTTSTIYDISGPSPVSGYYKERISDGMYKLHFHTPSDSDFASVIIYRGDSIDFSADGSHKIAQVNGGANSDMTYDDNFAPEAGKTYFYDIRAIDKAGNSSSLAGDGSTTATVVTSSATPKAGSGKVTVLPKEGTGSVLGTESEATSSPQPSTVSTPSAESTATNAGLLTWIMGHKKISLGVALILIVIGYLASKRKKS